MAITLIASDRRRFNLETELIVGRDPACSISLPNDSSVSRQHARFSWQNGLPVVEDLGSRNGTFLNGARITQARPISSGDEIRIGNETFRVEATLDNQGPTASTPKREASRGESRHQRKGEQSGAEGSLYSKTGVNDWNPMSGCAFPNINLSGCLKYLWIILLILIVAIVIGLIISGIATVLSSAGGAASQAVSGSTPSSSGQSQDAPPPPAQQAPPPPQNTDKPQSAPSAEGIHIEDVKVDFAKRGGDLAIPVVLVKWMNLTKSPVKRLTGTVQLFDRDGKLIIEIPRESIYAGEPVNPGEGHQDLIRDGGIPIRQKLISPPASAKVILERVE